MNFQFLAGLRKSCEQFLRQIFHYGTAQLVIFVHKFLEIHLLNGQQGAIGGTSGWKRVTEGFDQGADADAAIVRSYNGNGDLDRILHL